jgi:very-short-patch-repair endonuclease
MEKRELTQYGSRCEPARELRQVQTGAEKKLWIRLRDRQLGGFKFRRQFPIGPFFADFCCIDRRLIVEIDGIHHRSTEDQDSDRTHYMEEQGFRVIRFWNADVIKKTDIVCTHILRDLRNPG